MTHSKNIGISLSFILFVGLTVNAQSLPDSIVITHSTYIPRFDNSEQLYETITYSIIHEKNRYKLGRNTITIPNIQRLLTELSAPGDNTGSLLTKFGIDTIAVKTNPAALLKFDNNSHDVDWNEQQKQYIFQQFSSIQNLTGVLTDFLAEGGHYTLHSNYRHLYRIQAFKNNAITTDIASRRFVWGYKMPWINMGGEQLYNYNIEVMLDSILNLQSKTLPLLYNDSLLAYLVNKAIDNDLRQLYKLSANSYTTEIDELKTDFTIVSTEEVYGKGRYIWDEPKTIKVVLKNKLMLDNVYLNFLVSKYGDSLYSRDSVKKDYKDYVSKIQSITFISNYLQDNPQARLDIYYFNNKGINDYNIDGVNKSPDKWAIHDKWVEVLKMYANKNIKPPFDIEKSIETSRQTECGCNYRFDTNYLKQAIFFEIHDANRNSSIWFWLPGDKVLLYLMDNDKALNFDRAYFNIKQQYSLVFPCAMFNRAGERISK